MTNERETTDRVMLRAAVETYPAWSRIAAADPDRPIVVRMTQGDLLAIVGMILERKESPGKEEFLTAFDE